MSQQTELEQELAAILIQALDLDDIEPADIKPEAPLFGFDTEDSLGLDSIDALEIALAISKHFNVQLKSDDENNKAVFSNLRSLSDYIQNSR